MYSYKLRIDIQFWLYEWPQIQIRLPSRKTPLLHAYAGQNITQLPEFFK